MNEWSVRILGSVVFLLAIMFYCEWIHPFAIIYYKCSWPAIASEDLRLRGVRAVALSDLHLQPELSRLASEGDALTRKETRREATMTKIYSTINYLLEPEVLFVLGDVFDNALLLGLDDLRLNYGQKLPTVLTNLPSGKVHFVLGNHEVGASYVTERNSRKIRWEELGLSEEPVRLLELKGVDFLLLNSAALFNDTSNCPVCSKAEGMLHVTRSGNESRNNRPVILQHVPLFRVADDDCLDPDTEIVIPRPTTQYTGMNYVLSEDATSQLLQKLHPRIVVDGHLHENCFRKHLKADAEEWTLAPFGRRWTDTFTVLLIVISPEEHVIRRCDLIMDSTSSYVFIFSCFLLTCFWLLKIFQTIVLRRLRARSLL